MITVNTNTTSLVTNNALVRANSAVKTSLERLSTGFKINHAADDAANLSISSKISAQQTGMEVTQENTQMGVNLLQVAGSALGEMQNIAQRIRDLSLQSMNGTYSFEERFMMQQEVDKLIDELYRQKNSAKYDNINIFGEREKTLAEQVGATDTIGSYLVNQLAEEEAVSQGYTVIKSAEDFSKIAVNPAGKYCLMDDVNFSEVQGWTNGNFTGELNGNGFRLYDYSGTNGLFHTITGTVKNFSMENVKVNSTQDYTGGLCRYLKGRLENCEVSGSVKGVSYTGGILGQNDHGTVLNCTSNVTVTATGLHTGGLVGYNYGSFTNCSSTGDVTGTTCVGGLIAHSMNTGTIKNCYASGNVTGTSTCGGFIGNAYGQVEQCYSTGNVNATGGTIGGFAAINYTGIKNCYSLGDVISTGSSNIGGFAGKSNAGASISGSYCTGNVMANGSTVSGFANGDNFSNSYQSGQVKSNNSTANAFSNGSATNCYSNDNQPANTKEGQAGVTSVEQDWFNNLYNLEFLGDAYTYEYDRPLLKDNMEKAFRKVQFQVGTNSGQNNIVKVGTGFSLNCFSADVKTVDRAAEALRDVDALISFLSEQLSDIGTQVNSFESILASQDIKLENLSSTNSTIRDTDFAKETAELTKNQILKNATASLLAQSKTNHQIALSLLI